MVNNKKDNMASVWVSISKTVELQVLKFNSTVPEPENFEKLQGLFVLRSLIAVYISTAKQITSHVHLRFWDTLSASRSININSFQILVETFDSSVVLCYF